MDYPQQPPLFREIAAMLFGIVFAITGGYSGLEFLLALICTPLLLAGLVRLMVIIYRITCLIIPISLLGIILSIVGFGCMVSVIAALFRTSTLIGAIVTFSLVFLEAFFFIRDIRKIIHT